MGRNILHQEKPMDDSEKLAAIQDIIDQRATDADKVRQIRRLLNPPPPPKPIRHSEFGWPELGGSPHDPRD